MKNERKFLLAWVRKDPKLQEEANKFLVTAQTEATRPYFPGYIKQIQAEIDRLKSIGKRYPFDDARKVIASEIFEGTNGGTAAVKLRLQDRAAALILDFAATKMFEAGGRIEDIPVAVETTLGIALGIEHGMKFYDYQMGIYIEGKGVLLETYAIDVDFRPEPKIIRD